LPKFSCFASFGNGLFHSLWLYIIIYSNSDLLLRHINVDVLYARHLAKHALNSTRTTLEEEEGKVKAERDMLIYFEKETNQVTPRVLTSHIIATFNATSGILIGYWKSQRRVCDLIN
jgi:hypothetical protein